MTSRIYHHAPKVTLEYGSPHWGKIPLSDREFLTNTVDTCGGELSVNKWKKLFAVLGQLAAVSNVNYRIYASAEGLGYDVTDHSTFELEEARPEPTHNDVVKVLHSDAGGDALKDLRVLKFEISQLSLKIERLEKKREEAREKYDVAANFLREWLDEGSVYTGGAGTPSRVSVAGGGA
jgi:hypothetical protein